MWSKVRILWLAVTLGCVALVFVNLLQKQIGKKPKLEEYRSEANLSEFHKNYFWQNLQNQRDDIM